MENVSGGGGGGGQSLQDLIRDAFGINGANSAGWVYLVVITCWAS
jgi:hypothetical protein